MTTTEFLNKYDNKEKFSESELKDLFNGEFDYCEDIGEGLEECDYIVGDIDRWSHLDTRIWKIRGRYFACYGDIGNTEMQENQYCSYPVEQKKETIVMEKTIYVPL